MSKITATKFWRLLEPVGNYVFKRTEKIKTKERHEESCRYCKQPIFVADGQLAYFHAKCRKEVRSQRNQGKPRHA
jgi:hypothetical protein